MFPLFEPPAYMVLRLVIEAITEYTGKFARNYVVFTHIYWMIVFFLLHLLKYPFFCWFHDWDHLPWVDDLVPLIAFCVIKIQKYYAVPHIEFCVRPLTYLEKDAFVLHPLEDLDLFLGREPRLCGSLWVVRWRDLFPWAVVRVPCRYGASWWRLHWSLPI